MLAPTDDREMHGDMRRGREEPSRRDGEMRRGQRSREEPSSGVGELDE